MSAEGMTPRMWPDPQEPDPFCTDDELNEAQHAVCLGEDLLATYKRLPFYVEGFEAHLKGFIREAEAFVQEAESERAE